MADNQSVPDRDAILRSLRVLEQRIARIEAHLEISGADPYPDDVSTSSSAAADPDSDLELSIGEFGLAWAGAVVFFLGIIFLMIYALNQGHNLLALMIGYCAAAGFYVMARVWRADYPYLAHIVRGGSLLLAYYATLRLHYFTRTPLIDREWIALALLFAVVTLEMVMALVSRAQILAGLAVALLTASALLSGSMHLALAVLSFQSALAVILVLRHGWWRLLNLTIVLTYGAHLLWLLNDPVAGRPLEAVSHSQYSLAYLFFCAAAFAWLPAQFGREAQTDAAKVAVVLLNCVGFSAVVSLAAPAIYRTDFAPLFLEAFLVLIAGAIVQWLKTHQQFSPATYACFSFLALSGAIYGYAKLPEAFLWLALQSFLVVSVALWFRSRALVVVNAVIFLCILAAYWFSSPLSNVVNFTFALVALGSARVMNWQKERLTLRTDSLRIVYLGITFVMVLYSLYHAVPESYVSLSWTATAVGYFLLSLLLRNVKYRWMALFTLLATVLHLFTIDLAHLDPRFRVAAFLFLGLMAAALSVFYTRLRRLVGSSRN